MKDLHEKLRIIRKNKHRDIKLFIDITYQGFLILLKLRLKSPSFATPLYALTFPWDTRPSIQPIHSLIPNQSSSKFKTYTRYTQRRNRYTSYIQLSKEYVIELNYLNDESKLLVNGKKITLIQKNICIRYVHLLYKKLFKLNILISE